MPQLLLAGLAAPPPGDSAKKTKRDAASDCLLLLDPASGARAGHHRADGTPGGIAMVGSDEVLVSRQGRAAMLAFVWGKEEPTGRFAAPEEVGPLAASSDGNFIVAGGASGALYTWEASTGALLSVTKAHYRKITSLCFALDDSLVFSGSEDALVHVWDLASLASFTGDSPKPLRSISACKLAVTCVNVGGPSTLAIASMDHSVRLVVPSTGQDLFVASLPCAQLCVVVDVVGDVIVSGGMDGNVYCHPLASGSGGKPRVLGGHSAPVNCVCLIHLPLKKISMASGSDDGSVRLWNVEFEQAVLIIPAEAPVLFLLSASPALDPTSRKPDVPPILRKLKDDEETSNSRVVLWHRAFGGGPMPGGEEREREDSSVSVLRAAAASVQQTVVDSASRNWQEACARLYDIAARKLVNEL